MYYTSSELLDKDLYNIKEERKRLFKKALNRQNISIKKLLGYLDSLSDKHILIIGDTIVDQYIACDALGLSSEAPVPVLRELGSKEFIGGAAIVAKHINAFGMKSSFVSLLGDDETAAYVKREFIKDKIYTHFLIDNERPTIFKIRYMVGQQKILRVSRLIDQPLNQKMEKEVIKCLNKISNKLDGIVVSDFGYGMITHKVLQHILELSEKYNIKLFGDSQTSSQIGNISKFTNFFLIKSTEIEARIALDDKYNGLELLGNNLMKKIGVENIVLTLGPEGFISFNNTNNEYFVKKQHFPALNPQPLDIVGAGDSLLAGLAMCICAGAGLMEASAIGSIIASVAISKMGNIPVTVDEIKRYLETL